MGLPKLKKRLFEDVALAPFLEGIFPKDHPKNTRFSINFFTSIGLGALTEDMREHLKVSFVQSAIETSPLIAI
jgi:pre-mRNA-splicing factor CWC22